MTPFAYDERLVDREKIKMPPAPKKKKPSLSERAVRPRSAKEALAAASHPTEKAADKATPKAVPAHDDGMIDLDETGEFGAMSGAEAPSVAYKAPVNAVAAPVEFETTGEFAVPEISHEDATASVERSVRREEAHFLAAQATVIAAAPPAIPASAQATLVTEAPEPAYVAPEPPRVVVPAPAAVELPTPVVPRRSQAEDVAHALRALGDCRIKRSVAVGQRDIFAALWTAHGAHARKDGDYATAAMAAVLIDASARVPPGQLVAMVVDLDGMEHAVWVDAARRCVLGLATPPQVWLAGVL